MSKWFSVRGSRHYEVLVEVEDDDTSSDAASVAIDEFSLEEIGDIIEVPEGELEFYRRHCTDEMEL